MSLVEQPLPLRETGHPDTVRQEQNSYPSSLDSKSESNYSQSTYDESIYDGFYDMEEDRRDVVAPSPKMTQAVDAPALPEKSALRASRLLDNLNLKLGGAIETTSEMGRATPHDVYLSSEEDASSSADDFSDYDYDSSNEDTTTSSRSSHEVTARVVSVIFSGKPSIIDLSLRRRSVSSSLVEPRNRSSTMSSISPVETLSTPSSSTSSLHLPAKKASMLSGVFAKKKPPFLNIDPFANGSTYSLETTQEQAEDALKTPRTPTQLLKGMSKTIGLVRKRSRPLLHSISTSQRRDSLIVSPEPTTAESSPERTTPSPVAQPPSVPEQPRASVPSTVTYNDIIRAAKKNSITTPPPAAPQQPEPLTPGLGSKRRMLSGLAARRRSIKLPGRSA